MRREIVKTSDAPAAIGPYNQAVWTSGGRTLYLSGQIALDPATGDIVGEGDVRAQAERVLSNLEAVLQEAGMGFTNLVKVGIYLQDMADFAVINEIYARRFTESPPARACVQVAGLPKGVLLEIDGIAVGQ